MNFCRLLKRLIPPQRINTAILSFFGVVFSYAMRQCLAVAITEMVKPQNKTANSNQTSKIVCPTDLSSDSQINAPHLGTQYNWTNKQQGLILSSFYIGYVVTHIPGAILAQKYGGKWVLAIGLLSTAIFTILTPPLVHAGDECSYLVLMIVRFLMGVGEGTTFPALSVLLAAWTPESERAKIGSFVYSGVQIGSVISFLFSGLLLAHNSWDVVFYVWGGISVFWFIIFSIVCHNDPESDPFISQKECDFLLRKMGQLKRKSSLPSTPWIAILTSPPVLVLIVGQIGHDWGLYMLVSYLPKYMRQVLGFGVQEVGLYSSLPYIFMWLCSVGCGFLCDFLIDRDHVSITNARKIFSTVGQVLPGLFLISASFAECDRVAVIVLFVFGVGMMGPYYAGMRVNPLDLSPNYAGSLMALKNGIASLFGGLSPFVVGAIIPDGYLEQYRIAFYITLGILLITTVPFLFLASGEVQEWNNPQNLDEHENNSNAPKSKNKK